MKCLFCTECNPNKIKFKNNTVEFSNWYSSHKGSCCINHEGSSSSMEAKGAAELFLRSIEKRNLVYTSFAGDGDCDCFGTVKEECGKLRIGYDIVKEECEGHIQIRLGTALRQVKLIMRGTKLADGKKVRGSKRLTDKIIDKMQNHFGEAIRKNSGHLEAMRQDVWAVLKHMVRNVTETLE